VSPTLCQSVTRFTKHCFCHQLNLSSRIAASTIQVRDVATRNIDALVVGLSATPISSPVTGLEWPIGFQELKFPRFHDNGTGWW
jgi:hypothetical protein